MEPKIILFLDDDPLRAALAYERWEESRRDRVVWTTTAEETIKVIKEYKGYIEEISLDHDLGGEHWANSEREDCGMEVVRFLERLEVEEPLKFAQYKEVFFVIHSWNLPANFEATSRLSALGFKVKSQPFGT